MTAQVAADLRAAADVLERDGWTQHNLRDTEGRRCVLDALYDRSVGYPAEAAEVFNEFIGGGKIAAWNDAAGRTKEDVIAALHAAADRAEANQ